MLRYADCIFLYPHSGGLAAANTSATTEEKTTLAARSVQRYLDRTPTDAVRCCSCRSRDTRRLSRSPAFVAERPFRNPAKCAQMARSC